MECADVESDGIVITEYVFQEVLRSLSRHSGNGFSGWTFELIQLSCKEKTIASLFLNLINILAHGRVRAKDLWLRSRLIAIQKPNKKIRPIAVAEALIRLTSKCIAKVFNKANSSLAPYQYGVGVKWRRNDYSFIIVESKKYSSRRRFFHNIYRLWKCL
jgi:hypothetical protein